MFVFLSRIKAVSFRKLDTLVYKKAMLVFYEQNNINPFKNILSINLNLLLMLISKAVKHGVLIR